jgi:hypothetical protein
VARGITLASLVAFVKGGNNVDEDSLKVITDIANAVQILADVVHELQCRIAVLERINVMTGRQQLG